VIRSRIVRGVAVGAGVLLAACSANMMSAEFPGELESVSPRGGAANVSLSTDITVTFSHAMMPGMEEYVALHEGGIAGPAVAMSCTRSDGGRTLTCRPYQALAAGSQYTLHLGGGLMDTLGHSIGMGRMGQRMGGRWALSGMMSGEPGMMAGGWRHQNGSYGMAFEFTTR